MRLQRVPPNRQFDDTYQTDAGPISAWQSMLSIYEALIVGFLMNSRCY